MAGIYLHIPFCKKACHYCNFHFSTTYHSYQRAMVDAIVQEIIERKEELSGETIESIYFGGGTPSLLTFEETDLLLHTLQQHFSWSANPEITIEANPDDISTEYIQYLKQSQINRVSLGVQSFFDEDLQYMNRSHHAAQAEKAIEMLKNNEFLLSCDLIFGTPTMSIQRWEENLIKMTRFSPEHISAYALTVEPKTALDNMTAKGKLPAPDENESAEHMLLLLDFMEKAGYEAYEISNFARDGFRAVHNSNYWKQKKYLGIGPSAHSFNGSERRWNISNNTNYIRHIKEKKKYFSQEKLNDKDKYNEYVMTALRTIEGIQFETIAARFGEEKNEMIQTLLQTLNKNWIQLNERSLQLTKEGKLYADYISCHLFITEE